MRNFFHIYLFKRKYNLDFFPRRIHYKSFHYLLIIFTFWIYAFVERTFSLCPAYCERSPRPWRPSANPSLAPSTFCLAWKPSLPFWPPYLVVLCLALFSPCICVEQKTKDYNLILIEINAINKNLLVILHRLIGRNDRHSKQQFILVHRAAR